MYFLTVRGESRIWSLSQSSSAIRSSPQVRFSAAIRRINRLTSAATGGRPTGLDFQRQNRRNAARCQPINVAGLTMTNALRQSKKRASLDNTNRSAAVVGAAFFSRSWNKASCLRKNRFSAASAVRLRKPVPQKLMQSETTICNVTLSFESCRKMFSTWQSSHGYPLIRLPDHVFADHNGIAYLGNYIVDKIHRQRYACRVEAPWPRSQILDASMRMSSR